MDQNSYDCGIFMLCAIELLISGFLCTNTLSPDVLQGMTLSDLDIVMKRSILAYIINNDYKFASNLLYNLIISTLVRPNLRWGKSVAVQTTGNDHQINKSLDKKLKMSIFSDSHCRD